MSSFYISKDIYKSFRDFKRYFIRTNSFIYQTCLASNSHISLFRDPHKVNCMFLMYIQQSWRIWYRNWMCNRFQLKSDVFLILEINQKRHNCYSNESWNFPGRQKRLVTWRLSNKCVDNKVQVSGPHQARLGSMNQPATVENNRPANADSSGSHCSLGIELWH